jgi:hypothetical protein
VLANDGVARQGPLGPTTMTVPPRLRTTTDPRQIEECRTAVIIREIGNSASWAVIATSRTRLSLRLAPSVRLVPPQVSDNA